MTRPIELPQIKREWKLSENNERILILSDKHALVWKKKPFLDYINYYQTCFTLIDIINKKNIELFLIPSSDATYNEDEALFTLKDGRVAFLRCVYESLSSSLNLEFRLLDLNTLQIQKEVITLDFIDHKHIACHNFEISFFPDGRHVAIWCEWVYNILYLFDLHTKNFQRITLSALGRIQHMFPISNTQLIAESGQSFLFDIDFNRDIWSQSIKTKLLSDIPHEIEKMVLSPNKKWLAIAINSFFGNVPSGIHIYRIYDDHLQYFTDQYFYQTHIRYHPELIWLPDSNALYFSVEYDSGYLYPNEKLVNLNDSYSRHASLAPNGKIYTLNKNQIESHTFPSVELLQEECKNQTYKKIDEALPILPTDVNKIISQYTHYSFFKYVEEKNRALQFKASTRLTEKIRRDMEKLFHKYSQKLDQELSEKSRNHYKNKRDSILYLTDLLNNSPEKSLKNCVDEVLKKFHDITVGLFTHALRDLFTEIKLSDEKVKSSSLLL